jgi:hypothetical protein
MMYRQFFIAIVLLCSVQAFASDSLACTGKYNKKGEKHGTWACRKDNHVVRREQYKNGMLKGYVIFNEKGQVVETRDRKGKVRKFNPCGC